MPFSVNHVDRAREQVLACGHSSARAAKVVASVSM